MKNIELNRFNFYLFYNYIIILFLILFKFFNILITDYPINYFSEIHLKIKGTGNKNILNDIFIFEPSEVKINGILTNCKKVCDFHIVENNVILYVNHSFNTCENMFYLLEDIKEIDLSQFDFSSVTTTKNMFMNCTSLEKIYFGNINTSSLTSMVSMFYGCSNLISIDLSKFNIKKVKSFNCIFYYCQNLKIINLENVNTLSANNNRFFF